VIADSEVSGRPFEHLSVFAVSGNQDNELGSVFDDDGHGSQKRKDVFDWHKARNEADDGTRE
jgi:hypothetical protein